MANTRNAGPEQSSVGFLWTLGAFAVATLGLAFYLKKKGDAAPGEPAATPAAPAEPPAFIPEPHEPAGPAGPTAANTAPPTTPNTDFRPTIKTGSGFEQGTITPRPPFDYVVIAYTSRWVNDHWGQWEGPVMYDGEPSSSSRGYVKPERELFEFLEALTVTSSITGYWSAYKLQVVTLGYKGWRYGDPIPWDKYGKPGEPYYGTIWAGGRFGWEFSNSDGTHVTVATGIRWLGDFGEVSAAAYA